MDKAGHDQMCSIARALDVLGDRWTLLVLREAALQDVTRFAVFQDHLAVAANVLSERLTALVEAGVMEKRPYREPGSRTRFSYHLTPTGDQLVLILAALQQWGDDNRPLAVGPTVLRRSKDHGRPVRVAFVDDTDTVLPPDGVRFELTPAYYS